jgi:hypothetical protein
VLQAWGYGAVILLRSWKVLGRFLLVANPRTNTNKLSIAGMEKLWR